MPEPPLQVVTRIGEPPSSPAREQDPERPPLRVAVVQERFREDPDEHLAALGRAIEDAARLGARVVCLQELTLSPYLPVSPDAQDEADRRREPLADGPTTSFARRMAQSHSLYVHASLFEDVPGDDRGYNTAICVSPEGEIVAKTRKIHIPSTAGYFEDVYFHPGDTGYPVFDVAGAQFGFPTCW